MSGKFISLSLKLTGNIGSLLTTFSTFAATLSGAWQVPW